MRTDLTVLSLGTLLAIVSPVSAEGGKPSDAGAEPWPMSMRSSLLLASASEAGQPETVSTAPAEPAPDGGNQDLAKKLANPIADLISIPFQLNYEEGVGPKDGGVWRLNIQPVIPISLNQDWNVISRTILPVITQDALAPGMGSKFGLGDTVQSFFFAPKEPAGGWIWGAGPVFNIPTATDDALGSEKWGAGPTAVLLRQENGWTYGILANHIWSFAGNEHRDQLNATFLQPFLAYTFPSATTLTLSTESTYNWDTHDWTVPIIASVSQLMRVGKLPVSVGAGIKTYAVSPDGGPEWGARLSLTFLLPK